MLGTPDDADDVVQDAWLRWEAADRSRSRAGGVAHDGHHPDRHRPAALRPPPTARCTSARGSPSRSRAVDDAPFASVATAESLTLGFLTVLERLEPIERAVFLLHDVFGYPFAEVAASVERSEAATRQIAKRARDRVQAERPRIDADPDPPGELAGAFLGAVIQGDVDGLRRLLTDDVVHVSDGGANRPPPADPSSAPTGSPGCSSTWHPGWSPAPRSTRCG